MDLQQRKKNVIREIIVCLRALSLTYDLIFMQRSLRYHLFKHLCTVLLQVKAWGKGLEQALISRQNSFSVDCNLAGNNVLYVGVYGPDIPCDEAVIKHQGDKRYSVSYVVHQKGEYIIFVKWGDDHIPGSPYRVVA